MFLLKYWCSYGCSAVPVTTSLTILLTLMSQMIKFSILSLWDSRVMNQPDYVETTEPYANLCHQFLDFQQLFYIHPLLSCVCFWTATQC